MNRGVSRKAPLPHRSALSGRMRLVACIALLCLAAGCGSRTTHQARSHYQTPTRYYPPPGPSGDPWGPYIHEASGRFGIPERWVRQVMRQESGGQEEVVSWAGAMGLMQVMPDTYDDLRGRYQLGSDPFDPRNNILAGTAYLREMYDRYGAPGFLAAYNAGPNRLDSYLNAGNPLPEETVNYVASIAPGLGPGTPMSGPLAVYAGSGASAPRMTRLASGCDPNVAYDPDNPCTPIRRSAPDPVLAAPMAAPVASYALGDCDADAAYDPSRPCRPSAAAFVSAPIRAEPLSAPLVPSPAAAAARRPALTGRAEAVSFETGPARGGWAIQVGAFASSATAQAAAAQARLALPDLLRSTRIELPTTTPFGGKVAYRARLAGLSGATAAEACARLSGRSVPCMTVAPARDAF